MSPPGAIHGFDFAGIVVAVGEDLADPARKVGDLVAGMVHGGSSPDKGSFAGTSCPSIALRRTPYSLDLQNLPVAIEYLRVASDLVWLVPKSVSLREAAGVTATFATAAQSLFNKLDLPYPIKSNAETSKGAQQSWILIYGGSSSVGLFAVQLAKFAGYNVVATSSPRNFDLVKEYGADVVVDYHDAEAAIQEIKEATSSTLTVALDCISEADSAVICVKSLAGDGNRTVVQVGAPSEAATQLATERNVKLDRVMAFTLFGLVSLPLSVLPKHPNLTCSSACCSPYL